MHIRTTLLALGFASVAMAQNPGDNIFNTNQVLTIDLQFSQPGFWDSLVANYATETYMMADLTVTDNTGTYTFDSVGVRLKGNSSYGHPGNKKSFKIDFNRYVAGQEYDGLRKLNFNNSFKDPSFMREKIYYDICKADSIHAPRANYADVYMNDELWGFYSVVEQVDDEFLKTHFDENNENLFKAGDAFGGGPGGGVEGDLKYYGTVQDDYYDRYTLENNTDENDWTDLINLTDFINNSSDADFAGQLSHHFDVEQLMKCMVMYNMFSNLDSYLNSARNYYIYDYDSTGIWEWINWDCNESFGLYTGGPGTGDLQELDIYYYNLNRPLFERVLTIEDTKTQYETYYCELFNAYFNNSYISDLIDELYTLIQPHVYADPNKMYTNDQFETNIESDIAGGMGGTTYGLKSFVTNRSAYIASALDCSTQTDISTNTAFDVHIFPNPTSDMIYINGDFTSPCKLAVYGLDGLVLYQLDQVQLPTSISLANQPSGMYLVVVGEQQTIITKQQ